MDTVKLYSTRLLVNLVVFAILAAASSAIFFTTTEWVPELLDYAKCDVASEVVLLPKFYFLREFQDVYPLQDDITDYYEDFVCLLYEYLPSILITALNSVLPIGFGLLIVYERYEPGTELVLNITRCILIRLVSLVIAFFSVYASVSCDYARGCFDDTSGSVEPPTVVGSIKTCTGQPVYQACSNTPDALEVTAWQQENQCPKLLCWETYMGQQLYRLTMVDFLAQVVQSALNSSQWSSIINSP